MACSFHPFRPGDPAGARQRLSQARGGQPPVGRNEQGNLVIGGILVRNKKGRE